MLHQTVNNFFFGSPRKGAAGLLWTLGTLLLIASMIIGPGVVYEGALIGLKAWWNIVFPSLLPFFITFELLMSFGFVHFMGILLEPLMRPLFRIPGAGSIAVCLGFTSGFPVGALVTARLRTQGLCTRVEAERMLCFSNNSSPLFLLVAVSVGMFGKPELGVVIAGAHYLSNLTLGFAMRYYGGNSFHPALDLNLPGGSLLKRAWKELALTWQKENRALGKIMGDAVKSAVQSLLVIGGFIILFSVIIRLLTYAGIIGSLGSFLGIFLKPLGFSDSVMPAIASGLFEMTIGCKLASEAPAALLQQVTATSMILAFSGLCIHAQVTSMVADTDIRMLPFFLARIAHAFLAFICTLLLFRFTGLFHAAQATATKMASEVSPFGYPNFLTVLKFSATGIILCLAAIMLMAIACTVFTQLKLALTYFK